MSANDGSIDAEGIVQRQLDAYNVRDIDGFMAMWASDAQYFEHPAKLLRAGPRKYGHDTSPGSKNPICSADLSSEWSLATKSSTRKS
jgi:hypothetical protein